MRVSTVGKLVLPLLMLTPLWGNNAKATSATVKGYVLDSACAFTKGLSKPISSDCAIACARAGSPLVILSSDGTIYWPIAETTPSSSQNDKLMPYAGKQVSATGKIYERGGSKAMVIEKLDAAAGAQ